MLFINDSGGQPQKRGLSTHCLALEGHLLYLRQNAWSIIPNGSEKHGPFIINKDINVYERDDVLSNYHDLRTKHILVLDFDNAMPGFTLLRIYDVREWRDTKLEKELIHSNWIRKTWSIYYIIITVHDKLPCLIW
jgi:hypothetical protein